MREGEREDGVEAQCPHQAVVMAEVLVEERGVLHALCHSHYFPLVGAGVEGPKEEDQGPRETKTSKVRQNRNWP